MSRLDYLSEKCQTKRTVPATVEFVDIAGLVKGASKGEGLGNHRHLNLSRKREFMFFESNIIVFN